MLTKIRGVEFIKLKLRGKFFQQEKFLKKNQE